MGSSNQKPPKTDHGVIVPLITPVTNEGRLDEAALRKLVDFVITGGVNGIFVLGTTGEGPSVPRSMRSRIVHVAAEQADGRARVYAGLLDTVMADTLSAGADFLRQGADVLVATLPYYYPLRPNEQFDYYAHLAEEIEAPVLLYDFPATIGMSLDLGVIEHLRAFSNVVGIKDSSNDQERVAALLETYAGDSGFSVLVGSSRLAWFGLQHGADGFVPSAANLEPGLCARLYAAARKGDAGLVESLQRDLDALTTEYVGEQDIPYGIARLKRLMNQKNLCTPRVFPPLDEV